MKKFIIFIFTLVMVCPCLVAAREPNIVIETNATTLDLTAKTAVVMEAETGTLIYGKKKDEPLPPASVTKIMTLLLIFEEIDAGNLKKSEQVTVSEHAASMGGSQVFLEVGETQSVDDLLKCIVIASANDASVAMAEKVAGSEAAFVKKMNQKAKELGMRHTTFKNCCGLDAKGHETTAYDIALMSRELTVKHPDIFRYTKIWMDTITHKTKNKETEFGLSNTNKLIRQYQGCTGLKTGSTSVAKFCLSATANRNGVHLIAVVMASESSKTRIVDASKLLDYGFANCELMEDVVTKNEIGTIKVKKGTKESVPYFDKICMKIPLINMKKNDIKKVIEKKNLYAPVKKGDVIGYIYYNAKNQTIKKVPIKAAQTVKRETYRDLFYRLFKRYV